MNFARKRGIYVTIETEGSHVIKTDIPIDLISLSPKFSNSVPVVGTETPKGQIVDEKFVALHDRYRLNYDVIEELLSYHSDYHFKPVWDGTEENIQEIEAFRLRLSIPKEKTYIETD